jgi:hypothetical protein
LPVTAFAQPALTTTAFTRPLLALSDAFEIVTGAATMRFVVKIAAAFAPFSATIRARSGRFFRIPDRTPEAVKPFGSFISCSPS